MVISFNKIISFIVFSLNLFVNKKKKQTIFSIRHDVYIYLLHYIYIIHILYIFIYNQKVLT